MHVDGFAWVVAPSSAVEGHIDITTFMKTNIAVPHWLIPPSLVRWVTPKVLILPPPTHSLTHPPTHPRTHPRTHALPVRPSRGTRPSLPPPNLAPRPAPRHLRCLGTTGALLPGLLSHILCSLHS